MRYGLECRTNPRLDVIQVSGERELGGSRFTVELCVADDQFDQVVEVDAVVAGEAGDYPPVARTSAMQAGIANRCLFLRDICDRSTVSRWLAIVVRLPIHPDSPRFVDERALLAA